VAIATPNIRVGAAASTTLVVLYYITLQMRGISMFSLPRVLHIGQPRQIRTPTYWTYFAAKIPSNVHCIIDNILDLNSDHYSILLTISATLLTLAEPPKLFSILTDHKKFHDIINEKIDPKIKLMTIPDIDEAVNNLAKLIQQAAWTSTKSDKTLASSKITQILITS
jgi:hypothetical protein